MKLTTTSIKTLTLPTGMGDKTFFDDDLPGFGVRVRAGGSRKFVVQYDHAGRTRRVPLGAVGMVELGAARKAAKDILAARTLGRDPAAEKQENRIRALVSFGALLARYLVGKRLTLRPRSYVEVERHLLVNAKPLHHRPVADIDRRTLAALLVALTDKHGPTAAKCVRTDLSAYFAWLAGEGLIDSNPVTFVNTPTTRGPRTRLLTADELREIWVALGQGDYADIIRLLAFTAARAGEIGALCWDEVDLDRGELVLPGTRTKNHRPHTIPLAAAALAILSARPRNERASVFGRGRAGFAGWSLSKRVLDEHIATNRKAAGVLEPMAPWVVHDLRRLASTIMHDQLGVAPHIVERALGHVGHQSGVAGVYNKAQYRDEHRRALTRWAEYIEETVNGKRPATVVTLRK